MIRKLEPKSVFASSTIRGTILTTFSTILLAILPSIQRIVDNHVQDEKTRRDVQEVIIIVNTIFTIIGLGGAGTAFAGRVSVGDLWTPRGVPGPNREDFASPAPFEKTDLKLLGASRDTPPELQGATQNLENNAKSATLPASGEVQAHNPHASILETQHEPTPSLMIVDHQTIESREDSGARRVTESGEASRVGGERSPTSPKKKEPTYWSSKKNSPTG